MVRGAGDLGPVGDLAGAEVAFLTDVLGGMAALHAGEPCSDGRDGLAVSLGLSAWVRRSSVSLPDAYEVMMRLRRACVAVSGLDARREPVPLRVGDSREALRCIGLYLFELFGRAARHARLAPAELAERTRARVSAESVAVPVRDASAGVAR